MKTGPPLLSLGGAVAISSRGSQPLGIYAVESLALGWPGIFPPRGRPLSVSMPLCGVSS